MKLKNLWILAFAPVAMLTSCVSGTTEQGDDSDSTSVDSTATVMSAELMGMVGDGTSMNSIELVCDNGDTAYVTPDCDVKGGLLCGDIVYVQCDLNTFEASSVINMTSLSHLWAVDGTDGKQHLELDSQGTANAFNMDQTCDHWNIENGQLVLINGGERTAYDVTLLSDDSLVIENPSATIRLYKEN